MRKIISTKQYMKPVPTAMAIEKQQVMFLFGLKTVP